MVRRLARRTRTKSRYGRRHTRRRQLRLTKTKVRGLLATDELYVKLKFFNEFQLNSGAAIIATKVFSGNAPYQPIPTVLTSQATGFYQYARLYQNYMCFGSKISLKIITNNAANVFDIILSPETSNPAAWYGTTIARPQNQPNVRVKQVPGYNNQTKEVYMKHYFTTHKMFSTNLPLDPLLYAASTAGTPPTQWFWSIVGYVFGYNDLVTTGDVNANITATITYYTKFYNRLLS